MVARKTKVRLCFINCYKLFVMLSLQSVAISVVVTACDLNTSICCNASRALVAAGCQRYQTAEEHLIADLFRGYDTDSRGVVNASSTVTVEIQFMLLRIQRLDERSQVLLTTALVITEWKDERLTWDPKLYDNISDIVVRANRIWTPELAIINGAEDMIQEFEKIRVLVAYNGLAHWEPGGVIMTTCDIDIKFFPFDMQACQIEIGAWAYKSSRMNLTNLSHEVETQEFKTNGEWHMTGTKAEWKEIVLPQHPDIRYSKVVFTLYMSRRSTFYLMNIILPCTLLSVLILLVFCVPPDAGEKISVGISVLLAFTVFLLMLADNVPRTSLNVPILVIYLGVTMSLGTASVCLTVLVLHLHYRVSYVAVPQWVRRLVLRHLARLLGILPNRALPPVTSSSYRNASVDYSPIFGLVRDQTGTSNYRSATHVPSPRSPSSPSTSGGPSQQSPLVVRRLRSANRRRSYQNSLTPLSVVTDTVSRQPFATDLSAAIFSETYAGGRQMLRSNSYRRMLAQRETGNGQDSVPNTFYSSTRPPAPGVSITATTEAPAVTSLLSLPLDAGLRPPVANEFPASQTAASRTSLPSTPIDVETILHEWQLLARVLDRMFFFVVTALMAASAMLILLSPWYAQSPPP